MNIFEQASRNKLRFQSDRGEVTTEQLWDIPLSSRNTFNLDAIARKVSKELKEIEEISFVVTKPDPRKTQLELQLEILKYIIAYKISKKEAAEKAAETIEKKNKILAALAEVEQKELVNSSKEDLLKQLQELNA